MPIVRSKIHKTVRILHPSLVNIYDSKIGKDTKIAAFVEIGGAIIGKKCRVSAFVFIPPNTKIGNNVFIGPKVAFTNDKYPNADPEWTRGPVIVEDNVSIGIGAIILPNVRIGHDSFIAAGSMVTKNVAPHSFVEGSPAKIFGLEIFKKLGLIG